MRTDIGWVLAVVVCLGWAGNETYKWIRWSSTVETMQATVEQLIEFMNQGDRFTLEDGYELCESLADLQRELGRKPMNCEMLEADQ